MVDVVITWINGSDPALIARMQPYLTDDNAKRNDIAGPDRLIENGEIKYCVASIYKFAYSFVRKIYIVTDKQDPRVDSFIHQHFPDINIPIEIIDQEYLFHGYDSYYPVFNSIAIESMLYRIPGLSDNFIYLNDDILFVRPVVEQDFVNNGLPVAYCTKNTAAWAAILHFFKKKQDGYKVLSHRDTMRPAAAILSKNHFQRTGHTPHSLSKLWFKDFFEKRPDVMINNIKHKFRDPGQVNIQSLFYTALVDDTNCTVIPPKKVEIVVRGNSKEKGYLCRKLKEIESKQNVKFVCFNGLTRFSDEEMKMYYHWVEDRLGL